MQTCVESDGVVFTTIKDGNTVIVVVVRILAFVLVIGTVVVAIVVIPIFIAVTIL